MHRCNRKDRLERRKRRISNNGISNSVLLIPDFYDFSFNFRALGQGRTNGPNVVDDDLWVWNVRVQLKWTQNKSPKGSFILRAKSVCLIVDNVELNELFDVSE